MPRARTREKQHEDETCRASPLRERRALPAEARTWRTGTHFAPLPRFFLHSTGGANFSAVAHELRRIIGNGRLAEETIPIAFSQYLLDMPLVEALKSHPRRVRDPRSCKQGCWHVLGAMPFASRLLALLQANVTADAKHLCDRAGVCRRLPKWELTAPALDSHRRRMFNFESYLSRDRFWNAMSVPFLLLATGINIGHDLPLHLLRTLAVRNAKRGPVILAGVDRSGSHADKSLPDQRGLLRRMIVLPHVSSPEATRYSHAHGRERGTVRSTVRSQRQTEAPSPPRRGFVFIGDHGRFDYGARGAVRDYGRHLRAPHVFRGLRLMTAAGAAGNASRSAAHAAHRLISQNTTEEMHRSAMCFAPQGDSDTSRRLCASAGFVPAIS